MHYIQLTSYVMINYINGQSSVFLAKLIGTSKKTFWKVGHAVHAIMTLPG
jgi:hypothetical protein